MSVLARLSQYFQEISEALASEKKASAVFKNTSDAGTAREDLLLGFLTRHLPKRCDVIKGGFIFDSLGNESRQIDLIVINDLTLQFRHFNQSNKSFSCVEGCYAAISVKSSLDKKNLDDALSNLASVPPMPPMQLNPLIGRQDRFQELPCKVIFAFDALEASTLTQHLREYLAANPQFSQERRADLIIVNGQYVIAKAGPDGGRTRDGQPLPPYAYYPMKFDSVGSFGLVLLLTKIQNAANFGSQVLFDFSEYADALPYG